MAVKTELSCASLFRHLWAYQGNDMHQGIRAAPTQLSKRVPEMDPSQWDWGLEMGEDQVHWWPMMTFGSDLFLPLTWNLKSNTLALTYGTCSVFKKKIPADRRASMKNIETSECEPYMVTLHLHSRINGSARKKKRLNKKIKPKYKPLKSHESGKK